MTTHPSKKRNTGGNPNTHIQPPIFTDMKAAYDALHSGASDAVVILELWSSTKIQSAKTFALGRLHLGRF